MFSSQLWFHALLLLGWLALGLGLRFANLADKSASTIEISTLVFSLGHSFQEMPLERVISAETLLLPLQVDQTTTYTDTINYLMEESTHPPLYFMLTHWWMKLFSTDGELASMAVGRSLSAFLGAASIPAMFCFGWLAFRSLLVAQISAGLMAFSPYGIYLAQEARHYTLSILWIVISLSCLVATFRCLERRQLPPIWLGCIWVIANGLGIATHYFFSLVLCAEGLIAGRYWLRDFWRGQLTKSRNLPNLRKHWLRIYGVVLGTAIACLIWLPALQSIADNDLTQWIRDRPNLLQLLEPIGRCLGWWISMLFLLPVEGTNLAITVASAVIIALALLWILPAIVRGIRLPMQRIEMRLAIELLGGFIVAEIGVFIIIIYGLGTDLSLAARYQFVYFPAIIALCGVALASCWQEATRSRIFKRDRFKIIRANGKKVVAVTLILALLGSLTVIANYGYQKSRRSDSLAAHIQDKSSVPVLIATTYQTHKDIRTLMGLALDFYKLDRREIVPTLPEFLFVSRTPDSFQTTPSNLIETIANEPRPLDLWTVNFKGTTRALTEVNCQQDSGDRPKINGYRYRLYHCR